MRKCRTAQDVVDALGGLQAVCELTGANIKQAWNWTGRADSFPASTYVVMTRALRRHKCTAPPCLWNQRGVKRAA
jgi:hypothetical protein